MDNAIDRTPPQSMEAEMAVLSAMLLERDVISLAVEKLSAACFYYEPHRMIFNQILALYDDNQAVDLLTLTEKFKNLGELEKVGGASYVASLLYYLSTTANVEHYIKIVQDKTILRRLIDISAEIINQCYGAPEEMEAVLDLAERKVFEITQRRVGDSIVPFRELVKDSVETIEKLYQRKQLVTGIPTGFRDFDEMTSGLQMSDLVVFAARPSMGKTSFALNIVEYAALHENIPMAVFSLEMSKPQLVMRMLCSYSRVSLQKVRTGFLGEKDFPRLVAAAGKLAAAPIFIDDTPGITIREIRAKARRLKSKHDIKLIVLDYLQLMQGVGRRTENRQQEIADISRSLKGLARELNVPVVVISQLNRAVEGRQDHRPQLSDLRESGAIEQDADVVVLLLRREYYDAEDSPGLADVIMAKQRNGPTGDIKLRFFSEYTRFEDFTEQEVPLGIE